MIEDDKLLEKDCSACSLLAKIAEVRAIKKKVIRGGKKIRKKECPPGFRLVDGNCVKQKAGEKRKRKKGAKRAVRKKKVRLAQIIKKRGRSLRRRKAAGL